MCDSVVASAAHTASGVTLFAKNSDRRYDECQPLVQIPGAFHPQGSSVSCTHIGIPQVAETYRAIGHSPWWVWGFEHGVNEHGMAIGNHSVFSREPVEVEPGLIGMDLVRLGLERGRDAREALEVIAGLIEGHGQGGVAMAPGSGGGGYHNSFLLADPDGAWMLETSGRRWAARKVELAGLSNQLSLGADWQIGSRDLGSFARGEGWWRDGARVDVADAYGDPRIPAHVTSGRLRRSRELLQAGSGGHSVESMRELLRDHDAECAPSVGASPGEERFFTLCMHAEASTTTASMIVPLPEDRQAPWPVWVSFGAPCVGVFVPVYLEGVIPAIMAAGDREYSRDSAWWVFWSLHDLASRDLAHYVPRIRDGWRGLEERIDRDRARVEGEAREAAVIGNEEVVAEILSDFMDRTAADVLDCAVTMRARLER